MRAQRAQIDLARRMLVEGATKKTIAQTLKVSRSTSISPSKPYAVEASRRALTETQIDLARRMLADGVMRKIIAERFKVSRTTLHLALKPYDEGPFPKCAAAKRAFFRSRFRPTG